MSTEKPYLSYEIDKRNFNPLFFQMWNDDAGEHKRFIVSYGGAGSGKSFSITQREVLKCLAKKEKLLVIRKVQATLNDSCVDLFKTVLDDWEIPYNINITDKKITLDNGSVIMFKGLDNPEKIKSISNVSRIWIEEVTELDQVDFDQLNTRLRGSHAKGGTITMSFNPVSELHWVKKVFFDTERDDVRIYHSTYKDNKFLDEEYGKQLEFYKVVDFNHYRVYALGEFGIVQSGNECYRFDVVKNEKETAKAEYQYNPKEVLYLSFDNNVVPFCAVVCSQMIDGKLIVVDEFALDGKNIEEVCLAIKRKYIELQGGMIITGDATARRRESTLERGANFFTLIVDYLKDFHPTLKVPKSNQNIYLRILFVNKLFAEGKIFINKTAKTTMVDLQSVTWDKNQKEKDKSYTTRKLGNGEVMRFQKFGHHSDCLDYMVHTVFEKEFYQFKSRTKAHTMISQPKESSRW